MALPSSGTLSINDIVGEFGGSAPHSLSEYYRGGNFVPNSSLNSNIPTSGQIKISNFYGAANQIWDTTVTVGKVTFFGNINAYGYITIGGSGGSVSDGTVDFLGGATLTTLYWNELGNLIFGVIGTFSNTGFTSMDVAGTSFNRTAANYNSANGLTSWTWGSTSPNPFGTTIGATKLVTFT